ncbi:MAG: TolC family protein [Rhizorhabdus sp.]|uniref:TolC family protein n=1 Tax=Rhizorhabdus sp. TaxID=1968843 RepID=UPI001B76409F|nr:TolC family protein [Rhizorhabdus sp.]MBP8231224.1 TolC family protein [Rhizorhabdus sp.]
MLIQAETDAPRLAEARAGIAQAQGFRTQAGERPNPEASVEIENFSGRGPYQGMQGAETTFAIGQPLEWPGKRGARIAAGDAQIVAAQAKFTQARADFAYDLAVAYAEAEAAERRYALAEDALKLALDDERVAKALVEAGREAEVRIVQARAAVSAAKADRDAAKVERDTSLARLTAMSGSPVPFTSLSASVLDIPAQLPSQLALDTLTTPAVSTAQAEREAAARRVRVERMAGAPDVTASVGVRRFGEDDSSALVAGVSMPLPLFDRNKGNVQAAQAVLSAAEARLRAAQLDATADARVATSQLEAAESRVAAAREGEEAAAEAYRLTRIGYEGGKLPLSEVITARRTFAAARLTTIDAQLARVRAQAGLARLQGRAPYGEPL